MIRFLPVALLVFTVIVNFRQSEVIRCPGELSLVDRIRVMRSGDGTYYRVIIPHDPSIGLCLSEEKTWQEEWTDAPERGGRFIRLLGPPLRAPRVDDP